MRKQIAAANWKMNLSIQEAETLVDKLLEKRFDLSTSQFVLLGVPFPYLMKVKEMVSSANHIEVCAQNVSSKENGAYTGETSAAMLNSIGINYVIIGHSERRQYFHESNEELAAKVNIALAHNLLPVFCCGEALDIREAGTQNEFVEKQLSDSLFHLSEAEIKKIIIAYEPIWAIGTGKTASSEQAQEMHAHIRKTFADKYGADAADEISILYGGSVKAANAKVIFGKSDVDGGLIGGASLQAEEFGAIVNSLS